MDAASVLARVDRAEYPWEPQRFVVDEHANEMAYVDTAAVDTPSRAKERTILFVHGNPTWSYLWRRPMQALQGEHRCVAPDLVGFGCSDKPRDGAYHSLDRHIRNLSTLVRHLDLHDVTLVVHDWGGPIGLGWAVREPERVRSLVILNTWAMRPEGVLKLPRWYRALRSPGIGEIVFQKHNALVERFMPRLLRIPDADRKRQVLDAYRAPHPFPDDRVGILRLTRMVPQRMGDESYDELGEIEAGLGGLEAPTKVLWARRDPAFRKAIAHRLVERLPLAGPDDIIDLPGAGHFSVEDAPERVTAGIRQAAAT